MSKFEHTLEEKLMALLIYKLFKNTEGLDPFYIADSLGMNSKKIDSFHDELADPYEPLKSWIRLGGKVNFAWFENRSHIEWLTMGQHPFEQLRSKEPALHAEMKVLRDKSNKRWSNDWKQIQPKIVAAKSLMSMKPSQDSLDLTWQSMVSSCARKLQLRNMQLEAKKMQEFSLSGLLVFP
jgi:hypothetical protein